jgi:hypothetical protein
VQSKEVASTTAKQRRNWDRLIEYLKYPGITSDPFLLPFDIREQQGLARGYLQSIREGAFLTTKQRGQVHGRSFKEATSHVGQEFRRVNRPSPFHLHGCYDKLTPELVELFQSLANINRAPIRVAALTSDHLQFMFEMSATIQHDLQRHQSHLLAGAFVFGLRLGDYSHVPARGQTPMLCVCDFAFYTGTKGIIDLDSVGPQSEATYVSITFRNQKNGKTNEQWTHRKAVDPLFCPVRHWATIIHYILWNSPKGQVEEINFY